MTNTNKPSHRLMLVVERGRNQADFHEVCGIWTSQSGEGFNFTLPFQLERGDRLYIAPVDRDNAASETLQ